MGVEESPESIENRKSVEDLRAEVDEQLVKTYDGAMAHRDFSSALEALRQRTYLHGLETGRRG